MKCPACEQEVVKLTVFYRRGQRFVGCEACKRDLGWIRKERPRDFLNGVFTRGKKS